MDSAVNVCLLVLGYLAVVVVLLALHDHYRHEVDEDDGGTKLDIDVVRPAVDDDTGEWIAPNQGRVDPPDTPRDGP